MAARRKQRAAAWAAAKYHCRDCANSYGWCSPAIDGHLILCRCPYKQQGGKYCVFLSDPQCEHFKLRENGEKTE